MDSITIELQKEDVVLLARLLSRLKYAGEIQNLYGGVWDSLEDMTVQEFNELSNTIQDKLNRLCSVNGLFTNG